MKKIALAIAFHLMWILAAAQKTTINIERNGKVINQTINNYNTQEKDAILHVHKYIDSTKPIIVEVVDIKFTLRYVDLKSGYQPLGGRGINAHGIEKALQIKIKNGKLKLNCEVDDFNGKYIARVIDNKLILANPNSHI